MVGYLKQMSNQSLILWVYFIWYLSMAGLYFDASPTLWGNSFGLSLIVGTALMLATGLPTKLRVKNHFWQVFRLYLCPFCVSSFSSLTKGHGFYLIISPVLNSNLLALSCCLVFVAAVLLFKRLPCDSNRSEQALYPGSESSPLADPICSAKMSDQGMERLISLSCTVEENVLLSGARTKGACSLYQTTEADAPRVSDAAGGPAA